MINAVYRAIMKAICICVCLCVCVCVGVSWFQLFLHVGNRHIRNIIFILATTAKTATGVDTVAMNGLKFLSKDTRLCQCVCVRVCVSDI